MKPILRHSSSAREFEPRRNRMSQMSSSRLYRINLAPPPSSSTYLPTNRDCAKNLLMGLLINGCVIAGRKSVEGDSSPSTFRRTGRGIGYGGLVIWSPVLYPAI